MRLWILLLASVLAPLLQAQSLALSFDDGPDMADTLRLDAAGRNRALLSALKEARVSSVLFATGERCLEDPGARALVKAWGEAGHRIANHSYAHGSLGSKGLTLEAWQADFIRNDTLLQGLPGFTKWYRFPYLKEGDTAAKRDGARAFLAARGYRNGHVTIDASDWYYNARLQARLRKEPGADLAPYRKAYLAHLLDRAAFYRGLTGQVLGRDASLVLLLHHNLINALFLPDVIREFRAKGWTLVPPDKAYEDPLYRMEPRTEPAGESLLWALAREKGVQGLRYPAEDDVYEKPALDAAGL